MRALLATATLVLTFATFGCGYRLAGRGSVASIMPPGTKVIGIVPLRNETDQPEIESRITEALVDEFVRRGRYETRPSADGADVVLDGAITGYRLAPVSLTQRGQADRFEVVVTARIRLVQHGVTDTVLWSQNFFVFREQYDVPETPTSGFEREIVAVEDVARGVARSVITSMLEGF